MEKPRRTEFKTTINISCKNIDIIKKKENNRLAVKKKKCCEAVRVEVM